MINKKEQRENVQLEATEKLDLSSEKSVIQQLVEKGYSVYGMHKFHKINKCLDMLFDLNLLQIGELSYFKERLSEMISREMVKRK